MTRKPTFECPAFDCDYEAPGFQQLRGHVNGMRPQCEYHDSLPPLKKHEFY